MARVSWEVMGTPQACAALITELGPVPSMSHAAVHFILTMACEEGIHRLHFIDEGTGA